MTIKNENIHQDQNGIWLLFVPSEKITKQSNKNENKYTISIQNRS